MFKAILQSAEGLQVWSVAALVIFLAVFAATSIRAIMMDKNEAARLARLPLDDNRRQPDDEGSHA